MINGWRKTQTVVLSEEEEEERKIKVYLKKTPNRFNTAFILAVKAPKDGI